MNLFNSYLFMVATYLTVRLILKIIDDKQNIKLAMPFEDRIGIIEKAAFPPMVIWGLFFLRIGG